MEGIPPTDETLFTVRGLFFPVGFLQRVHGFYNAL